MRFENDQFESGIRQSTQSLEMLRKALRMDDIASSVGAISNSFGAVDLSHIAQGIDDIAYRTSAWGIVTDEILRKLTDGAMGLIGKIGGGMLNMVKQGGLTRAMNIEQAKFQLGGLGVAWDDVSDSINYAVKGTRYGLDEAAVAASNLVASGVQLGDSMSTALRAISGTAAMTNREYSDIGQIFGTVAANGKLMTMQLRQLSISGLNASAAIGKFLNKTPAEIEDMVSKGQIDFETFAKAMDSAFGEHATRANETFTGAFANMKAAFARIGENFWNPLLQNGRDVLNTFTPVIDAVKSGLTPAFELWGSVVEKNAMHIQTLLNNIDLDALTKKISTFGQNLKNLYNGLALDAMNEDTNLGKMVAGLAAAFDMLKRAGSGVFGFLKQFLVALAPLGEALAQVGAKIGEFLVWLNKVTGEGTKVEEVFRNIADGFAKFVSGISNAILDITSAITGLGKALKTSKTANAVEKFIDKFKPGEKVVGALKIAFAGLGQVGQALAPVFTALGDGIAKVFDTIGAFINSGNLATLLETFNAGFLTFMVTQMMDLGKAGRYIQDVFNKKFGEVIKMRLRDIKESINDIQLVAATSTKFSNILKTAAAIALLAGAMYMLSKADPEGLGRGLAALSAALWQLVAATKIMMAIEFAGGFGGLAGLGLTLVALGIAVGSLSKSIVRLSELDMDEIVGGIFGIAGAMVILVKGAKALASIEGRLAPTAAGILVLALALNMMALAVRQLGSMDLATLGKGLGGLGVMLLELSLFMSKSKLPINLAATAAGMLVLGIAMNVLAASLRIIGGMDWESMLIGLTGMAGVLASIAGFSRLVKGGGTLAAVGAGMLLVGTSMIILAQAMTMMAALDWNGIGKGLAGIGGSLMAMAVATKIMPGNLPAIAAGVVLLGLSLQQIATAFDQLSGLSWEGIGKGLAVVGASLMELAVAVAIIGATGGAGATTGIAAIVGAFALFIPQLIALSQIPWPALLMGLGALAISLVAFGVTATVLAPLAPVLLAIAGALALFGVAMAGIGIGLTTLTAGLLGLGAIGAGAFAGIIAAIKELIALLPYIFEQLGLAIVALVTTIADSATTIVDALVEIVKSLLAGIRELAPDIIDTVLELVQTLLDKILEKGPAIAKAGVELLKQLLAGIRDNIGDIVSLAVEIVIAFANSLVENVGKLVLAGIDLIVEMCEGMAAEIPNQAARLGTAAADLGAAIIEGVIKGLGAFASRIGEKLVAGAREAMGRVKAFLGINSPSKLFRDEVGKQIVAGVAIGATDKRGTIGKALVNSAEAGLHTLQKALKINSPSVVFQEEVGRWIAEGITEGIEADDTVEEALKKKADNIVSAFQTALNRSSLLEDIARLNFEVWEQLWPDASDTHYYIEYKRYLNEVAKQAERRFKLAEDELEQTIKVVGRGTDEALEATRKMLEARKTYLEARQAVADLDIQMASKDIKLAEQMRQEAEDLTDAQITLAQSQYELWKAMNPDASELEAAKRNVMYFNEQLELQEQKIEFLKEKLQETIAEFGSASKEVVEAQNAYLQAQKKYYDLINNRKNVVTSYKENAGLNDDDKKALEDAKNVIREQESNLADYERILRDLAETNERYSFGWSVDEMDAIARKQSGYNREAYENAKKTQQRIEEAMEKGVSELEKLLNGDYTALVKQFKELGWQYADALGKGFEDTMSDRVIPMMNNALNSVKQNLSNATEVDRTHNNSSSSILVGTGGITGIKNPSSGGSSVSSGGGSANKIDTSVWKPSNIKPANPNVTVVANTNFNQTNNSPKTLSNSSIYRSTSSMFAGITGKVTSAVMGAAVSSALKKVVNA